MTFLIVREDLMGRKRADTPYMLDWELFANSPNQDFNTPATWPIYVAGLNFKHMLNEGGLLVQQEKAVTRSKMIYDLIDNSDGYYVKAVMFSFTT